MYEFFDKTMKSWLLWRKLSDITFGGHMSKFKKTFFTQYMNFLEIPLVLHQRSSFLIATLRSKDLHLFYSNKKEQKKIHEKGIWQKSCRETFSRLIFELCMIATNHYCYITAIFVSNRMSGSSKRAKKLIMTP